MAINKYVAGDKSLLESAIDTFEQEMRPETASQKRITEEEASKGISLGNFVEATSPIVLESWQNHLCKRLEKLRYQTGQRILIHKPPQHGGSVIVSQRLPAYLIGNNPSCRVRLACFNIEHATKFTAMNKDIMLSPTYKSFFPDPSLYVPSKSANDEFSTRARTRARDAQSSLKALGLQTGFVGSGADDLIIDDPYPSPQAAESPTIRATTWLFWTGSAKVRIDGDTNVIVMFHRYNEEDFVGQMIQEEGLKTKGGTWELLSYRAEWDGDERLEVGGPDPVKRDVGDYLSPRKAAQPTYYEDQKKNPKIWQSQFQGKPSNAEGSFFLVNQFQVIPKCPVQLVKVCRAWDIASSTDGDWTVGVLMGLGIDELVYILDVVRVRQNTNDRDKTILLTATLDNRRFPNLPIRLPQDPAAAGKDQAMAFTKLLKGFNVVIKLIGGDKETRADPWSKYVNAGLVKLVSSYTGSKDDWVPIYVEEHRKFPNSVKKDQIDASSDAFAEISLVIEQEPGEDFDTMGLAGGDDAVEVTAAELEQEMITEIILGDPGYLNYEGIEDDYKKESSSSRQIESPDTGLSTIRERKNLRQVKERRFRSKRSNQY